MRTLTDTIIPIRSISEGVVRRNAAFSSTRLSVLHDDVVAVSLSFEPDAQHVDVIRQRLLD